jgi:hypothetical protein
VPGGAPGDGDFEGDEELGERNITAEAAAPAAQTASATNAKSVLRECFADGLAAFASSMSVHCFVFGGSTNERFGRLVMLGDWLDWSGMLCLVRQPATELTSTLRLLFVVIVVAGDSQQSGTLDLAEEFGCLVGMWRV